MRWYYADQDVSIGIDYLVGDAFVVPTSATYSVYNAAGTVLTSGALPAALSSEPLLIGSAHNGIGADDFQQRFVSIFFVHEGQTYQVSRSYGLFNFIPLSATPDDVRRELGIDSSELPDDEVDVTQAYFTLASIHAATFTAAFAAGGVEALSANKAVVLQAALDIVDSLRLRTFSRMQSEDALVERFAGIDFDALKLVLRTKLSNELEVAKGTSPVEPTIFDVSTPTDVITNT